MAELLVAANFIVGACYNVPDSGWQEWVTGATCGAQGAYVVRIARKGTMDKPVCGSSDADTSFTIEPCPRSSA